MEFVGNLKDGLRVLIFDANAARRLARDRSAFDLGILVVLGAGLALGLWGVATRLLWLGLVLDPVAILLLFLAGTWLCHLTAGLLGGDGAFLHILRPASCAFLLGWGLIFPPLGLILLLWFLAVLAYLVSLAHEFSVVRGILAVALPLVVVCVLALAVVGARTLLGV